MRNDPAREWRELTAYYSELGEDELLQLAADFGDLTAVAQQCLRDEMKKRGLGEPEAAQQAASAKPEPGVRQRFGRWSPMAAASLPEPADRSDESAPGHEYTWKTQLCECRDGEHAWQIAEVLRQAGIESWIEAPAPGSLEEAGPRVMVAADQLEEAHAIAERPIPQEIVEQSKAREEEFAPPVCPKCGASDPLLAGVNPANTWECDVCGAQWRDAATTEGEGVESRDGGH